MKFTGDAIPALFIPLLGFNANDTSASNGLSLSDYDGINASAALSSVALAFGNGGSPTAFAEAALHTHHHHHEHHDEHRDEHREQNEHERDRRENHWDNVGSGEGFRRPRAGQQETRVRTRTQLQEANECPSPPILSCSAQAASTDTCCVSLRIR